LTAAYGIFVNPVPWHRIELTPGVFDWSWIDGPMQFMREHGMNPILDPIHHVSFPAWLEGGLLHPDFPALALRFVQQIERRYPWAMR
jgi:beta-glucosidase